MQEEIYKIRYNENGIAGMLKPNVLLDYLSDIACDNANKNNIGYEQITTKNYAWFLLKYAMEFNEYPQNLKEIKVTTDPRGGNKHFCFRNFYLNTIDNKPIGNVSSIWGIVDLSSKKMLNPFDVFGEYMHPNEKSGKEVEFDRIPNIENCSNEKVFEVMYGDIDINHHVNNANYLLWAEETLPVEFLKNKRPQKINIAFKKELKYGNSVLSQVEISDNKTIHSIKNINTSDELCSLMINWK